MQMLKRYNTRPKSQGTCMAISLTTLEKERRGMRRLVLFWNFRISMRALVPGRKRRFGVLGVPAAALLRGGAGDTLAALAAGDLGLSRPLSLLGIKDEIVLLPDHNIFKVYKRL